MRRLNGITHLGKCFVRKETKHAMIGENITEERKSHDIVRYHPRKALIKLCNQSRIEARCNIKIFSTRNGDKKEAGDGGDNDDDDKLAYS